VKRFSSTSPIEAADVPGSAELTAKLVNVLLEIGHVARPHGLRGEVVVDLLSTVEDRLAPGSALDHDGRRLVVEASQALPGKASPRGGRWLVRFAGLATREEAERLVGATLRAEPLVGAEGLWVHELIGSEVVDQAGEARGKVAAVEANPASDLLVLDNGALVPLRFVVSSEPGKLTVDAPAGLFGA
jgi:16S rRNA processing protein RimM